MTGILNRLLSGFSAIGRAYGSFGASGFLHSKRTYPIGDMYCCDQVGGCECEEKETPEQNKSLEETVKKQSNIA